MTSLIFNSNLTQSRVRTGIWILFVSLAVASPAAQSAEGSFALKKETPSIKSVNSYPRWQPYYRLNTNLALNRSKDTASTGAGFSNSPRLFLNAEPKAEDNWSINIQKQNPSSNDCLKLPTSLCLGSTEEQPEIKTQRDSFWLVLRKAFHF
jgi:hypothetical protein